MNLFNYQTTPRDFCKDSSRGKSGLLILSSSMWAAKMTKTAPWHLRTMACQLCKFVHQLWNICSIIPCCQLFISTNTIVYKTTAWKTLSTIVIQNDSQSYPWTLSWYHNHYMKALLIEMLKASAIRYNLLLPMNIWSICANPTYIFKGSQWVKDTGHQFVQEK